MPVISVKLSLMSLQTSFVWLKKKKKKRMGDLELLLTKCKQGRPCLQSHALKSQCGLRLPSIARYIPLFGHTKTQHTPGQPSKTKCGCPSDGDLKTVPYAVYLLKNGCTTVKKKKKKKWKGKQTVFFLYRVHGDSYIRAE